MFLGHFGRAGVNDQFLNFCLLFQLMDKIEALYLEISRKLEGIEQRSAIFGNQFIVTRELRNYILELKDLLKKERTDYNVSSRESRSAHLQCNLFQG